MARHCITWEQRVAHLRAIITQQRDALALAYEYVKGVEGRLPIHPNLIMPDVEKIRAALALKEE